MGLGHPGLGEQCLGRAPAPSQLRDATDRTGSRYAGRVQLAADVLAPGYPSRGVASRAGLARGLAR